MKAQQYDKRKASPGTIQMATNGDTDCSYLMHCRDSDNEKQQGSAKQGAYGLNSQHSSGDWQLQLEPTLHLAAT